MKTSFNIRRSGFSTSRGSTEHPLPDSTSFWGSPLANVYLYFYFPQRGI
ncbi:MAG TPA: hypothetical protein PL001_00180 [Candidatus Kryptobacter bacterium]|nr:hypothetical protein [Candidatus Kryptobacter bacterium]